VGGAAAQEIVLAEQKFGGLEEQLAGRLADGDLFGAAVAPLGDLDGDGVGDLAVGAPGDGGGAVWILIMSADGTVRESERLTAETGELGELADEDGFGSALASLDDLDGDGVRELAIGAPGDGEMGFGSGAVWIVFPRADGSVKQLTKITAGRSGLPVAALAEEDAFGSSLARIGDLDGDGVAELAVGTPGIDDRARDTGGVWVLYLTSTGTVRRSTKISAASGHLGFVHKRADRLGTAVAAIGDLNRDGVPDLAVGAPESDDGAASSGAVWILFLRPNGYVAGKHKLSGARGPLRGELERNDLFGTALASPGDLDGDGIQDLLVGAPSDDDAAQGAGAVWVLSLDEKGGVVRKRKITNQTSGFDGALQALDLFGSSIAVLGDLDGLVRPEVVVGAPGDDDGGTFSLSGRGAVWVLFLDDGTYPQATVRNGSGLNELTYTSTNLPFIGQTWIAEIDAAHHDGASMTVIVAFDRPYAGLRTSFGELLVGLRGLGGRQVFRSVADSGGGMAVHANPIPDELALVGHRAYTQGVILGRSIELLNAIDLRVGY